MLSLIFSIVFWSYEWCTYFHKINSFLYIYFANFLLFFFYHFSAVKLSIAYWFLQDLLCIRMLTLCLPHVTVMCCYFILFYFIFNFIFLLCNTVLGLPYIDMNPPQVYMSSQPWTRLSPPSPYHLSGSSSAPAPSILYPVSNLD